MEKITLNEYLKQGSVVENLKNFVGVTPENTVGLMTPERLAAVAGGLEYKRLTATTSKTVLIKLGKVNKNVISKDLFEVIVDHAGASLSSISVVSIGNSNISSNIRCYIANIKGTLEMFYDKDTFDYFIKPFDEWDNIYIKRIDCVSSFSYEKVEYNAEQHVKVGA